MLFEGPPGTGKTFVAKAMAKEANVPFLFVSASAFQSMYYGQTNRKIRSFFKQLRKHARKEGGAIGFIEEIDAIGASRRGMGGSGGTEGVTGVVNELLVQLQSFDTPDPGPAVRLGLDRPAQPLPARRRQAAQADRGAGQRARRRRDQPQGRPRPGADPPGPLRPQHLLRAARPRARADIIAYYLGKKAHGADLDEHGAVDIVAGMTFGYSPAALERLMDESLVIALTHGRSAMTMSDVAEAKMLVELGVTDETIYTPDERDRVATHEAGHATVAYFVGQTRQLDVLSIVKRRDSLGLLQHSDTEERFTKSSEEMHALLQIAMGGMVAEEHWFDEVSTGPASDLAAATAIGAQMIGACGMGNSLISVAAAGSGYLAGGLSTRSWATRTPGPSSTRCLMGSCDAAKTIVAEHPEVVEALRDALSERDELVGAEITEVIEAAIQRRAEDTVISSLRRPAPVTVSGSTSSSGSASASDEGSIRV